MIAALSRDRGLGLGPDLLWWIPDDLKRFKEITTGHPVIMGQTTYESIGKPLPNRTNIVLSLDEELEIPGCIVAHSLPEAFKEAKKHHEEVFVIGGGSIYKQALPYADKLYLTLIDGEKEADVFFPEYEHLFTKELSREDRTYEDIHYSWVTLGK